MLRYRLNTVLRILLNCRAEPAEALYTATRTRYDPSRCNTVYRNLVALRRAQRDKAWEFSP